MKMIAKVHGIKRSKGIMRDTGKEYDSTTLYIAFPFDETSGDMRGAATQPMKFGKSDNFVKFDGLSLPFDAEVELETVTNGNKMTQQVINVVPVKAVQSAPVAK